MKLASPLLLPLLLLPLVACTGPIRSAKQAYELPDGYVARHEPPPARERAERTAAAELERRGWVRPSGAEPLEIVVIPALRQTALQRAGGLEWDPTGPDDRVLWVAVRDGRTGKVVYETVIAEAE